MDVYYYKAGKAWEVTKLWEATKNNAQKDITVEGKRIVKR